LESVPGYGRPNHPAGETSTGADGLALFPGLASRTTVSAKVHHPELLPQQVQGLYAAPGALSFRDVVLEEGGTVRGRVTVKGKRQEGATCRVSDLQPPVAPNQQSWKRELLYEGKTDREGICRSTKLPAGSYVFLITLPENKGQLDRNIVVTNGSGFEEEFAFSEIRVSGKVTRGEKPAPGFTIRALENREEQGIFMVMAEGKSGEDGGYEISLWKPGRYEFALYTRPKTLPVIRQTVVLEKDQEPEAVDFSLESMAIRGKVVDREGRLLEEAWVTLRWNVLEKSALTDERGEFEFLLDSEGKGDIRAQKKGYREAPLQEISLESDAESPPITLVLVREKPFKGKILSAAGSPVAGAWVEAVRSFYGDEPIRGNSERTDAEGRFELPPVAEGRNRLFVSGPDCPLSIFEPSNESGDLSLRCQGQPSVLDLTIKDAEGHAVANASVILRRGAVIIPAEILSDHLGYQGLRAETDLAGRLVMPNLAPGDYEIFLADPVTAGMIEAGSRTGYLASARLSPWNATVLQLTSGVRVSNP
jgi:protocatechuate 3,4-dioxygenase beta subunit